MDGEHTAWFSKFAPYLRQHTPFSRPLGFFSKMQSTVRRNNTNAQFYSTRRNHSRFQTKKENLSWPTGHFKTKVMCKNRTLGGTLTHLRTGVFYRKRDQPKKIILNYIWGLVGIFSISFTSEDIHDVIVRFCAVVSFNAAKITKWKLHTAARQLENVNFVFSCWKQYSTHSLHSFPIGK